MAARVPIDYDARDAYFRARRAGRARGERDGRAEALAELTRRTHIVAERLFDDMRMDIEDLRGMVAGAREALSTDEVRRRLAEFERAHAVLSEKKEEVEVESAKKETRLREMLKQQEELRKKHEELLKQKQELRAKSPSEFEKLFASNRTIEPNWRVKMPVRR